jgi:hypothetical protein
LSSNSKPVRSPEEHPFAVTPGVFDGVVKAIEAIESEALYSMTRVLSDDERGYAIAVRR